MARTTQDAAATRAPTCALLADVRGSRGYADQAVLLDEVRFAAKAVDDALGERLVQPFAVTVGDELQAEAPDVETALAGAALLALHALAADLAPALRLRFGIGVGEVLVTDPANPRSGQSGTAWWHAREALDGVAGAERRPGGRRSTSLGLVGPATPAQRAAMVGLDALLAATDALDAHVTLGLRDGLTHAELAERLDVRQSTISRRAQGSPLALVDLLAALLARTDADGTA